MNTNTNENFSVYILSIGLESIGFKYSSDTLKENIPYFKKCFKRKLSPYKALLLLYDYMNGEFKI